MKKKNAVILLNLGGPDNLSSVRKFLFNLFYDPNIIQLINPFRWLLAKFIAAKRAEKAQEIYAQMGGGSTILPITLKQAQLLEMELNKELTQEFKVFVSMRYWHPFASEVIKQLEEFKPDEILLLPLYPQFSTTTTKSSLNEFTKLLKKSLLKTINPKAVCCYYKDPHFIKAHVDLIREAISVIPDGGEAGDRGYQQSRNSKYPRSRTLSSSGMTLERQKYRILFSAHGLPEKIIKQGDPYQWQIEQTSWQIVEELALDNLDYVICYQSRVGPLKWIGPSTEEELSKAAAENIAVIIVPIAFVSDHSETLVELDLEYKELFSKKCAKDYVRIPALNMDKNFIQALANQTKLMLENSQLTSKNKLQIFSQNKCSQDFKNCFCKLS